jgi:isocitrate/isopropylmalate dehydrogenase
MAKDRYDVAVLPGDGIGVEVAADARALIDTIAERIGVAFALDEIPCGGRFYLEHGRRDWPDDAEARCDRADVILLGAVGWAGADGQPVTMHDGRMAGWSPVIGNRIRLDLYANVRPVKVFPGLRQQLAGRLTDAWRADDVDLVVIRENTEGLYSGMGGVLETGGRATVATDTRLITRTASEKVIRRAFELSRARGRGAPADGKRRVTCVVKHNVLHGCRLFLDVFREVGAGYPDVEQDVAIVDAFAMFVLTQPQRYDVVVTTNMFGDILTDLASVLQGGMGMAVGCNVGDRHAMFEPIHGSAPPLAGTDRANPIAMLLATGEALGWLGREHGDERLVRAHRAVEAAVAGLVERGEPLTADLVGAERGAPRSVVAKAIRDDVAARLG